MATLQPVYTWQTAVSAPANAYEVDHAPLRAQLAQACAGRSQVVLSATCLTNSARGDDEMSHWEWNGVKKGYTLDT